MSQQHFSDRRRKKKVVADQPTLLFSAIEPQTQLFFFFLPNEDELCSVFDPEQEYVKKI